MPRGIPKRKEATSTPAPGGAVTEVRGPVKDMLAPGSEENFLDSLPESTSTEATLEPPTKRKYTKRTSKEVTPSTPTDAKLERAKQKCAGGGVAGLATGAFTAAGKPLNTNEYEDLDDQFYLIANKVGGSGDNWIFIIVYTIALLGRLILVRTQLGEEVSTWLKEMFKPKEQPTEEKQEEKKAV